MDVPARINALRDRTALSDDDLGALEHGAHTLKLHAADKMIENVIGVLGLPLGVGARVARQAGQTRVCRRHGNGVRIRGVAGG